MNYDDTDAEARYEFELAEHKTYMKRLVVFVALGACFAAGVVVYLA